MKLKDDFFLIKNHVKEDEQTFNYLILLNKEHSIYQAHFPGNHITPGVCLIQICKELLQEQTAEPLMLVKLINVKFLAVINPDITPEIQFLFSKTTRDGEEYKTTVLIRNDDTQFAKLHLLFRREPKLNALMKKHRICIIIPTYDHAPFLEALLKDVLRYASDIIVVNDGSRDDTKNILAAYSDKIETITLPSNKGKGFAIQQGINLALSMEYNYAITIDSDGQHKAFDLATFIDAITLHPNSMLIGCRSFREKNMPAGNKFANKLSNFWFTVLLCKRLPDTQCGYRLYPIQKMKNIRLKTSRYEAELEYLLRLAWKNIPLIPVHVNVSYLPKGKRISHYKTSTDFFRISLLNTIMFFVALFYGYPSMIVRKIFTKK